jgi:hypothetical protein
VLGWLFDDGWWCDLHLVKHGEMSGLQTADCTACLLVGAWAAWARIAVLSYIVSDSNGTIAASKANVSARKTDFDCEETCVVCGLHNQPTNEVNQPANQPTTPFLREHTKQRGKQTTY